MSRSNSATAELFVLRSNPKVSYAFTQIPQTGKTKNIIRYLLRTGPRSRIYTRTGFALVLYPPVSITHSRGAQLNERDQSDINLTSDLSFRFRKNTDLSSDVQVYT